MKKLYILLMAAAVSCTPGVINGDTPSDDPSENPSVSEDPSADVFDPKGSVKTVTKESWMHKRASTEYYMFDKLVRTITYDAKGRPEKEAEIEYCYDESGELLPEDFGVLKRNFYYIYSDGKMEIRQHPEEISVYFKADIDDKGLITHCETGNAYSGTWQMSTSGDYVYEKGRLVGIDTPSGPTVSSRCPWIITWSADGNITESRQQWDTPPAEITDDDTKYYYYGSTHNITLGTSYDVSCMLIDNLNPYGFMGRGTELLPEYANSTYRNKVLEFDYQFSRTGPLEKVTVDYYPFASEGGDWNSVTRRYIYSFEYYE